MEGLERFIKYFPRSDDVELVLLKGHLLVGEEMNDTLRALLRNPGALFSARLSFSKRLAVLHAVHGDVEENSVPYAAIEHLNTLRNALAHKLDQAGLAQKVECFVNEVTASNGRGDRSDGALAEQLKNSIASLCGALAGVREAGRALRISTGKNV